MTRIMSPESRFVRQLSSLRRSLQELETKSLSEQWLLDFCRKLRQTFKRLCMVLIDRATVKPCEDCHRPIRPLEGRVWVTEFDRIHQRCWQGRQFFREYICLHEGSVPFHERLPATVDISQALSLIESIVTSFYDAVQRNGKDSPQNEYIRGMLNGAKSMFAVFRGHEIRDVVLDEVRRRTGKPLPNIIPLAEDGNRYGWDMDAEDGRGKTGDSSS